MRRMQSSAGSKPRKKPIRQFPSRNVGRPARPLQQIAAGFIHISLILRGCKLPFFGRVAARWERRVWTRPHCNNGLKPNSRILLTTESRGRALTALTKTNQSLSPQPPGSLNRCVGNPATLAGNDRHAYCFNLGPGRESGRLDSINAARRRVRARPPRLTITIDRTDSNG
jgi:hypothetical protein